MQAERCTRERAPVQFWDGGTAARKSYRIRIRYWVVRIRYSDGFASDKHSYCILGLPQVLAQLAASFVPRLASRCLSHTKSGLVLDKKKLQRPASLGQFAGAVLYCCSRSHAGSSSFVPRPSEPRTRACDTRGCGTYESRSPFSPREWLQRFRSYSLSPNPNAGGHRARPSRHPYSLPVRCYSLSPPGPSPHCRSRHR